ncbi:hypothetical protein MHYP_G00254780 [Metynnis hypsauchen]
MHSFQALNSILSKEDTQNGLYNTGYSSQKQVRLEHQEFFKRCDEELIKVNNFYTEKLTEANRRLASFGLIALDGSGQGQGGDGCVTASSKTYKHTQRKKTELCKLKMAVGELYLGLVFLQSYQELNYRGFCKITKKYNAKFACEHGLQWKTEKLDTSFIYTERTRCGQMMVRLETFMLQLEGGNKQKALRRLQVPLRGMEQTAGQWITFRIGVTCGLVIALLTLIAFKVPQQLHPLFFHSLLLLLLLNPTPTCHSHSRRWLLTVMWKVLTAAFRPVGFAECWLADQLNSLSPLILSLWEMLCFYTAQISWKDLQDGSFLYTESLDWEKQSKVVPCLIQCFPPWLRFTQCLRCFWDSGHTLHLLNAGKYSTVFLMVTFAGLYNIARERAAPAMEVNAYLYLWAVATCLSVLVTVSWDLRMDWGLLQGNGLLKEELVYSREVYYYAAMLADVLLRISWAINILLAQMKDSAAASTASAVLAPLEVLRRSMWNLFRLENEHLKNCEQCRAVRDFEFPSRTVNMPEQFLQEKLMDQDELDNTEHNTSTSHHKPTCLPFRYLRPAVEETNLPIQSPKMEPAPCP